MRSAEGRHFGMQGTSVPVGPDLLFDNWLLAKKRHKFHSYEIILS
jgi:hypothetical protein